MSSSSSSFLLLSLLFVFLSLIAIPAPTQALCTYHTHTQTHTQILSSFHCSPVHPLSRQFHSIVPNLPLISDLHTSYFILISGVGGSKDVQAGPCPIHIKVCGKLHGLKWRYDGTATCDHKSGEADGYKSSTSAGKLAVIDLFEHQLTFGDCNCIPILQQLPLGKCNFTLTTCFSFQSDVQLDAQQPYYYGRADRTHPQPMLVGPVFRKANDTKSTDPKWVVLNLLIDYFFQHPTDIGLCIAGHQNTAVKTSDIGSDADSSSLESSEWNQYLRHWVDKQEMDFGFTRNTANSESMWLLDA